MEYIITNKYIESAFDEEYEAKSICRKIKFLHTKIVKQKGEVFGKIREQFIVIAEINKLEELDEIINKTKGAMAYGEDGTCNGIIYPKIIIIKS